MKGLILFGGFLAVVSVMASDKPELPTKQQTTVQAVPVIAWLKSVQTADVDLYKTVWSDKMLRTVPKEKEAETWMRNLQTHRDLFAKAFGEYKISDFAFTFEGEETRGRIIMEYKGRILSNMKIDVVKEESGWKVN